MRVAKPNLLEVGIHFQFVQTRTDLYLSKGISALATVRGTNVTSSLEAKKGRGKVPGAFSGEIPTIASVWN